MELLKKYFPELTADQLLQFKEAANFYQYWNERINVISRADIENLEERHFLHSLAIAKVIQFNPGTQVLDLGTGGGFPGIPLAIYFPEVKFNLVDSIGKKVKVVEEVTKGIGLKNVTYEQVRGEGIDRQFDFVVNRAVTELSALIKWVQPLIFKNSGNDLKNGLLSLKGGKIDEEVKNSNSKTKKFPIKDFFEEDFFKEKYVLHTAL